MWGREVFGSRQCARDVILMIVGAVTRKYVLAQNRYFRQNYSSSFRAVSEPSSRFSRQIAVQLMTFQLILHYLPGTTLTALNTHTEKYQTQKFQKSYV